MKLRFTSVNFKKALQERQRVFNKITKIAARLSVPPELSWWYWQEFGTATHNPASPKPTGYVIRPVNKKWLAWPDKNHPGAKVLALIVPAHPGFRPRYFVRTALPDIQIEAQKRIGEVLLSYDPEAIRETLVYQVLPFAKQKIADGMKETLQGTREDGRLENASAGDVFSENAFIHDTSDQ